MLDLARVVSRWICAHVIVKVFAMAMTSSSHPNAVHLMFVYSI
jgi:hypothetical protein